VIEPNDLTFERLEVLSKLIVDKMDLGTLMDFAESALFQDYQHDFDQAASDANDWDLTLEELNQ